MIAVFVLILIAVGLLATKILHRYISVKKIPWYVYISVWIGWFMCFGIIILVPIDILGTDYRSCLLTNQTLIDSGLNSSEIKQCEEPYSYISNEALTYIYKTFYFGTLLLTWLVYPLLGSFVLAGDFHLSGRITRSIKENAYLYLIFGVIGFIVMIWLLAVKRLDWNSMVGFAMAAANTWGLCLVIVLMGYGLVETPRSIWFNSQSALVLKHLQFKAVDLLNSKKKANEELISTLKIIKKIHEKTKKFDPYEKYIKIIIDQCPPEYAMIQNGEGTGDVSYSILVSLNSRLKNAITNSQRSEFLYDQCLAEAFELQDIENSKLNLDKVVSWSFKEPRTGRFARQLDSLEWIWYNYLEVTVLRASAILFGVLSVLIIWSEFSVAFTSQDISILSNIIKHTNVSNIGVQLIIFFPLGYEALTCYSTLFKIRIFNYYRLIPHQHSDSNSIIFSAAYLCRLGAPLCFNFIQFINMHADFTFSEVMGTMDVAPFLGSYFFIYFPLLIVIVCLSTLFNLYSRIMNCLNITRFRFDVDFTHDQIDEGKFLIDSERRKWTTNNIKPLGGSGSNSQSPPSSLDISGAGQKQIYKSGSTSISKTNNNNNSRSFPFGSVWKKNNSGYDQSLLFDESLDLDNDDGESGTSTYNAHISNSMNNNNNGGSNNNSPSTRNTSIGGFPSIFSNKKYSPLPPKK